MIYPNFRNKNDLGYFTKPRGWTGLAYMCYQRGCVCDGCEYSNFRNEYYKCQVKAAVLETVRLYGIPEQDWIYEGEEE